MDEEEQKQKITTLEQQVKELLDWKKAREEQQIVFPLDSRSRDVLANYFMRIVDTLIYIVVGAEEHVATSYVGNQGALRFEVGESTIYPYSVDPSSVV